MKTTIKELSEPNFLIPWSSAIWENKHGCDEYYLCANALFVLYCLAHSSDVIIDHAISTPGNGKDAGDGLYANEKIFLIDMVKKKIKLPEMK